jgi:SNF2 family DNA or RNA helicase
MDRAHRTGQMKQVYIVRFTTDNSIEERTLECSAQKSWLVKLVIQQGRRQQLKGTPIFSSWLWMSHIHIGLFCSCK